MFKKALIFPLLLTFLFSACQTKPVLPQTNPTQIPQTITLQTDYYEISGKVIDLAGNPISNAQVNSSDSKTNTDESGRFILKTTQSPAWVTVDHPDFIKRVRVADESFETLFRLTPDDGKTITLQFLGDTMFGRRFFDPNEDGVLQDGLLSNSSSKAEYNLLLADIEPLLSSSDLTVLNFESPLSNIPSFSINEERPEKYHPTKDYVYASHPYAVEALQAAGVDLVDIGNNHFYDLLEDGIDFTTKHLDNIQMPYFGGGKNENDAWQPKTIALGEQLITFIGCTTIWRPFNEGGENAITYIANNHQNKGGAAYCEENTLKRLIFQAKSNGHIVIAMIHGGYEYEAVPSQNVLDLSLSAQEAGADFVINHHSHVISGFSLDNQSLIAWSLGNFLFDQTLWATFPTYSLNIHIREGKLIRAYIEPLIIQNYTPSPSYGSLSNFSIRTAAGQMPGPFIMENNAMEIDLNNSAIEHQITETIITDNGSNQILTIPDTHYFVSFEGEDDIQFGRNWLWNGDFENSFLHEAQNVPAFWNSSEESTLFGKEYAYQGENGLRLTRGSSNQQSTVISPLHRITADANQEITISGYKRSPSNAISSLQISWYDDTKGVSFTQEYFPLSQNEPDEWENFTISMTVPENAVAVGLYFRLEPPQYGTSYLDLDNLQLIKWSENGTLASPLFDTIRVSGSGIITYGESYLPGSQQP